MNFYSFEEINNSRAVIRFVQEVLGYEINSEGRCQAKWRGGKGFNVALEDDKWFDHKKKVGGGLIELCEVAKFSGDVMSKQLAQEFLGNWLGLTPKNKTVRKTYDYHTQSTRYAELVQRGFEEKKKYVYTDENGTPCHFVIRMEHPTEHKQFIQCTPYSGSLRDVKTYLYNLPVISQSEWAVVVEGEKDADTLISMGIPGTTCNCGSDHWQDDYTESLRGKDIVICRDNDDAGNDHTHLLLRSLANAAKSLRVVCPSKLPKGDITDWMQQEGGSKEKFMTMMKHAPLITPEEAMWSDEALALYRAKKANEEAFANYRMEEKTIKGKSQLKEVARTVTEMVDDIYVRFLRFPRRLGQGSLFDHDRDTNKIEMLTSNAAVFAWIGEKSKHIVNWKQGPGFVTKEEFYCALMRNAISYEKISEVPNYPKRNDVYYTFRDKLKASDGHAKLAKFMEFFNPEDKASAILMRTMLASMMYYRPGIQRPCWIIDSKGGQAAGKTTFAELACYLYKCKPIKTNVQELSHDAKELNKRLVSVTGRNSMMLLVDNVRGTFDNAFFADLVTGFDISGKAPYGIGEETRPNDLTYVLTSNSANIGSDMASRSFIFYIAQPKTRQSNWKEAVMAYIDANRYEILGDIYDILEHGETPEVFAAKTRVPEFEAQVLYKIAENEDNYHTVLDAVLNSRESANVDEELAVQAMEIIRDGICKAMSINNTEVEHQVVFLRTRVVNSWLKKALGIDIQDVRNMVNTNRIKSILREPQRFPRSSTSSLRASGVMFVGREPLFVTRYSKGGESKSVANVTILGMLDEVKVQVMGVVEDDLIAEAVRSVAAQNADEVIDVPAKVIEEPAPEEIDLNF